LSTGNILVGVFFNLFVDDFIDRFGKFEYPLQAGRAGSLHADDMKEREPFLK
jgi:hypothetical protein